MTNYTQAVNRKRQGLINIEDLMVMLGMTRAMVDYRVDHGLIVKPTHLVGKRHYWTMAEAQEIVAEEKKLDRIWAAVRKNSAKREN